MVGLRLGPDDHRKVSEAIAAAEAGSDGEILTIVSGDSDSYRYLAESIRMHPPQEELAKMMEQAGFDHVQWFNLTAGVCALHVGTKY